MKTQLNNPKTTKRTTDINGAKELKRLTSQSIERYRRIHSAANDCTMNWWIPVVAMFVFATPAWSQFKEPALTEITAGGSHDFDPTFSSDMLEVFWTGLRSSQWDIWSSRRESTDAPWEGPEPLNAINTGSIELSPHLSSDGLTLTYGSQRRGGYGGLDLWQTTRVSRDAAWQEPVNMGPTINTRRNEGVGVFSTDELELIMWDACTSICSTSPLRRSTRETLDSEWTTPKRMTPSERGDEIGSVNGASLSPDGLSLYFSAPGSYGDYDIFVSSRPSLDAPFGKRENLGETINSSRRETTATIAPDGSIYYAYNWDQRPGMRIWRAEAALVGDANLDDEVSFADFLVLSDNFGKAGDWSKGDFDGNGKVEFPDFLLLSNNFGRSAVAASVPEPSSLAVFCLSLFGLTIFRRPQHSRRR